MCDFVNGDRNGLYFAHTLTQSNSLILHSVERFLKIVEKYTDIRVLTPEILREFIERIEVHERSVYRGKNATQQIDIYYNFTGLMP